MAKETPISREMEKVNNIIFSIISAGLVSDYVLIFMPINPEEKACVFLNGKAREDPMLKVEELLCSAAEARRRRMELRYPFDE